MGDEPFSALRAGRWLGIGEDQGKLRLPVALIGLAFIIPPAALAHGNVFLRMPFASVADDVRICMIDLFSAQFWHVRLFFPRLRSFLCHSYDNLALT